MSMSSSMMISVWVLKIIIMITSSSRGVWSLLLPHPKCIFSSWLHLYDFVSKFTVFRTNIRIGDGVIIFAISRQGGIKLPWKIGLPNDAQPWRGHGSWYAKSELLFVSFPVPSRHPANRNREACCIAGFWLNSWLCISESPSPHRVNMNNNTIPLKSEDIFCFLQRIRAVVRKRKRYSGRGMGTLLISKIRHELRRADTRKRPRRMRIKR